MALPVFICMNATSGGQTISLTAGNSVQQTALIAGPTSFLQGSIPLLYDASYFIIATAAGAVLTFLELFPDNQWRALSTPAPITTNANMPYNGSFPGEFLGLRITVTTAAGAMFGYLKAALKTA